MTSNVITHQEKQMQKRFRPMMDIWALSEEQRRNLIPGQWVSAGTPDEVRANCGRFYGVKTSGSTVVAWNGNARKHGNIRSYQRALYFYAKGI